MTVAWQGKYGTGISTAVPDVATPIVAWARSAAEQKRKEYAEKKDRVDKNYEKVLNATSINAPAELTGKLRERYEQEMDTYKNEVTEKFINSDGQLSIKQEREIQDGFNSLQQRMLGDVNDIKRLQDYVNTPYKTKGFDYAYDRGSWDEISGDIHEKIMSGEDRSGDWIRYAQTARPTPVGDYLLNRYGGEIKRLNLVGKGNWTDKNTFRFETSEDEAEVDRQLDDWMQDSFYAKQYTDAEGNVDEAAYDELKSKLKDVAIKSEVEFKSYKPSTKSGSTSSSTQELFPTQIETTRGTEDWYNYPSGVPQTKRTIDVKTAYDADTGEQVDVNDRMDYSVVSFNPNNRRVRIQTTGGEVESGGAPLLYDPSMKSVDEGLSLSDKRKVGRAKSKWENEDVAKGSLLKNSTKFDNFDDVDEVKNVKLKENENGDWVLSGELIKYDRNWIGNKKKTVESKEKVETILEPITDKSVKRTLELDIDEYRGVLSPLETKWRIGERTVRDVLNQPSKKTTKSDPLGIL